MNRVCVEFKGTFRVDETNIGWDEWLHKPVFEKSSRTGKVVPRTEIILSEDGLMLNTGFVTTVSVRTFDPIM